jgi:hypothetical protein
MKLDPPQREKFVEWMPVLDNIIPKPTYAARSIRELPLFAGYGLGPYWQEIQSALQLA